MTAIFLISLMILMAFASRAHGAGTRPGWPSWGREASYVAFFLSFGVAAALLWGWPFALLGFVTVWSLAKGHGNFYHDGTEPTGSLNIVTGKVNVDDPEWLEIWLGMHWLLPRLSLQPRSAWYCRIMMAIKGALIAVPTGIYGAVAMAVILPAAYCYAFRVKHDSAPAEWIRGAAAGLIAGVAIIVASA